MPGPTASSEFRRGLNPYNLRVGAGGRARAAALGLFVIITGMHTATHRYFGWRFARGIRAASRAGLRAGVT